MQSDLFLNAKYVYCQPATKVDRSVETYRPSCLVSGKQTVLFSEVQSEMT